VEAPRETDLEMTGQIWPKQAGAKGILAGSKREGPSREIPFGLIPSDFLPKTTGERALLARLRPRADQGEPGFHRAASDCISNRLATRASPVLPHLHDVIPPGMDHLHTSVGHHASTLKRLHHGLSGNTSRSSKFESNVPVEDCLKKWFCTFGALGSG